MLLNVIKSVAGVQAAQDVAAELMVADELGDLYDGATDRERYEAARAILARNQVALYKGRAMSEDRKSRRRLARFVRDLVDREPALLETWAAGIVKGSGVRGSGGEVTDTAAAVNNRLEAALDYYEGVVVITN